MNRIALFAHFDRGNEVKPFTEFMLRHLGQMSTVGFVSTSALNDVELEKIRPHAKHILLRDNIGYDFGMWRHALETISLDGCDELILANSSVFGPIFPLAPIFESMAGDPCDFWGMTDSFELTWHLQSYFIVFKKQVLDSQAFRRFWSSVLPYRNKAQVILSYEVGISSFLVDSGFRGKAFAPVDSWATRKLRAGTKGGWNSATQCPMKLLDLGMPFVKVAVLRDNPARVPLKPILRAIRTAGYPPTLIPFDTRPWLQRKLTTPLRRLVKRVL